MKDDEKEVDRNLKFAREQFPGKSDKEALDLLILWESECYESGQTY